MCSHMDKVPLGGCKRQEPPGAISMHRWLSNSVLDSKSVKKTSALELWEAGLMQNRKIRKLQGMGRRRPSSGVCLKPLKSENSHIISIICCDAAYIETTFCM